jgi:ABC-type sulfate transport system substrate-binding protein
MYLILVLFGSMIFIGVGLLGYGLKKFLMKSESYNEYDYEPYDNQQDEQEGLIQEEQFRLFNEEIIRQQDQQFMEESLKSVTPFEMGGYDMTQGNSFNDFNNEMF